MSLQNSRRLVMGCVQYAHEFLLEEDGPTAVEYAVMLALIIGVCAATVNELATSLNSNLESSAEAIINATS